MQRVLDRRSVCRVLVVPPYIQLSIFGSTVDALSLSLPLLRLSNSATHKRCVVSACELQLKKKKRKQRTLPTQSK